MGDVGDEALLHGREALELADLALEAVGHPVEGRREEGEVVLAARRHPFVELAGGQSLGDLAGPPDGRDDLAGHDHATAPTSRVRMMPATTNELPMRSIVATSCPIG